MYQYTVYDSAFELSIYSLSVSLSIIHVFLISFFQYLSGQVLASVLFNSCDILRVDLDGVLMLLPHILDAIQLVLNDLPNKYK